ncbi:PTS system D-mannitol-specific IIB component (Fru family) /PTS system D-mannitol-specific IIC component (Fru family) [Nocardiopsis sp. Huas11]|uniref:PTS mannitol transporter subunit IICB n=1 Tax=Nocardiopsis sp. Huas11 TaxID=2183912 RepID=UPI000EB39009|nr:PTS mannitol transporter subunit IICB [Nocardiopsis sp. Huas11]RKS05886.1 PTS system D-mannitol-specific IIB component (Fru family) /PTS system D-mannitol-specific IIC component (Fru family) [Nocardiopsis sp. Huas11]
MSNQQTSERLASVRSGVQRFGGFLSSMVMPNIGAFIAWGLLTALFIESGWTPNATLAELVGPMITFLLPLLIAYTGGHLVYDRRGGVVGAVAAMGVIVAADMPMFLGAMVMGPLGAYLIKKVDQVLQPRTPTGFEMLVNNFSAGILGGLLAALGVYAVAPAVTAIARGLGAGVQFLIDMSLLPLVSVIVEPAKVLFLNNALNHGVLGPLGVARVAEQGKAIEFLIETNPGPGLGILLACLFFGPKISRATAPGAIIIHFFGGIHEIYFPYILAQPKLILAAIGGGMSGVATFMVMDAGLLATPAPGSIIALMAVTPRGDHLAVLAGVTIATLVSFALASALLGFGRAERRAAKEQKEAATAQQNKEATS